MKNSGPNSPQTIRGLLNRRSQRALLDTRAQQEADILTAPMVGPFGKGFHTLHTPAGTEYVVGDASGITFAPNAQVMVANPGGLGNRAVLGGAPANKKGGAARSRNPRRRGTPVLESNQYAFGADGLGSMLAMLYSDGTYVSTRATRAEPSAYYTGCILSDSSAVVGDGSLIMRSSEDPHPSAFYIWDVEGEAFYSYSVPGGWIAVSALYYQNGALYWIECENFPDLVSTNFDVRLRSSATDLSGASTITTVNLTIAAAQADLGGSTIEFFAFSGGEPDVLTGLAVDADGAVVYLQCTPQDGNGERTDKWPLQLRFSLAGGAPVNRLWSAPESYDFIGATLGTSSFALAFGPWTATPNDVYSKSDDATAAAVELWDSGTLSTISAFNVGTGGAVLQAHSATAGVLVRGVSSGVVIASAIDAFDGTNYPTAMFYFGV